MITDEYYEVSWVHGTQTFRLDEYDKVIQLIERVKKSYPQRSVRLYRVVEQAELLLEYDPKQ